VLPTCCRAKEKLTRLISPGAEQTDTATGATTKELPEKSMEKTELLKKRSNRCTEGANNTQKDPGLLLPPAIIKFLVH
jgi:hypothetical protein